MKVIDPGHKFALRNLDAGADVTPQYIEFVKRVGPKYGDNAGPHPGTTIQEVCRALISRLNFVDDMEHDVANHVAISNLRNVLRALETRAAKRHGRPTPLFVDAIEEMAVCPLCGHIGCSGECGR